MCFVSIYTKRCYLGGILMSVMPSYSDLFQARLMSVHSCNRAKVLKVFVDKHLNFRWSDCVDMENSNSVLCSYHMCENNSKVQGGEYCENNVWCQCQNYKTHLTSKLAPSHSPAVDAQSTACLQALSMAQDRWEACSAAVHSAVLDAPNCRPGVNDREWEKAVNVMWMSTDPALMLTTFLVTRWML